jgi:formate hydrogenlyase transcriptional activator
MHQHSSVISALEPARSRDQLRLLMQVSEAIATHRNLNALCRDLAERLPAIIPFEFIALVLHDPEKNVMRIDMLGTAAADSIPPGMELPIDQSFSGLVFTQQQAVIVATPADAAARFQTTASLMKRIGAESFCMLPLTTSVRPLGAMAFGSSRPRAFDEGIVEFLQLVVTQVAVAVGNVLHAERAAAAQAALSHERDRLRLVLEVSESIASHRRLDDLFRDLAERLPRVVPVDYINLLLHDATHDVMRLHIIVAPAETTLRTGHELPVEGSATGQVWRTQQPVVVEDLETEQRFPLTVPIMRERGIKSFCALPLTTALRRLGTLGFGSLAPRVYQEADLNFMQQVTNQVAVAVDNVLHEESAQAAHKQLTRDRDRQRLLLEVNNAVVSSLDLDAVFTAVSACLRRVIPHDGSSLLLYEPETHRYRIHVVRFAKNDSFIEEGQTDIFDKSPASVALTTRRTALFDEQALKDLAAESKVAERLLTEGVKSFCCVPLLSHDRLLGTLNVGSTSSARFTSEDVELLGQVAQQIAIAVENGLAYRRIAELTEQLNKEKLYLEDEIRTEQNFDHVVGRSAALKQVLKQVEIVAPTESTVLIEGETGTGKELIARAIHELSGRRARTFVKLNCAAIPTGLLESELFGHERGAFTGAIAQRIGRFELANGGTLFLDEVGDIRLELQAKLLRVLQEQEFERLGGTRTIRVDIRLVAATNRNLTAMVAEKQFRSDLYYRLNVFPIANPPLRDRREDIAPLVHHFTNKFARRMNKTIETIPAETMAALTRYHWPGNIRELENLIERAVILSRGPRLDVPLPELKQSGRIEVLDAKQPLTTLEETEREHIRRALEETNWQVGGPAGAAARLGLKRTTLQARMARLGITRPAAR